MNAELEERIENLPDRPGVYLFRDGRGRVLYVGKSVRLRSRVRSYFRKKASLSDRKRVMVGKIRSIDVMVTANETEALIAEYELIRAHDPPYNVVFRDDKSYPMLEITSERWPRLVVTRRRKADRGRYFGPYTDAKALRTVVKALRALFPLRKCSTPSARLRNERPCLNYEMGLCLGPCAGLTDEAEYAAAVEGLVRVLKGRHAEVEELLRRAMEEAAAALDFEKAAGFRDRLQALGRLKARQRVVGDPRRSEDVVAVARKGSRYCLQVINIRGGRLAGQRHVFVEEPSSSRASILGRFLAYSYIPAASPPERLLVSEEPEGLELLSAGLAERFGREVHVSVPRSGRGRRLMEMALDNARMRLDACESESEPLAAAASVLGLERTPRRIECFDISISGGSDPVASLVVFVDGRPAPGEYRKFRIKTVDGTDDFASMREAVRRRYARVLREGRPLPDLVLVDGGKGQVSAARSALDELGLDGGDGAPPVFGLAKREERIFGPGLGDGLVLEPSDPVRRLFERIRDEAHRKAVGHHRLLRRRRSLASELDRVPGIGPALRKKLLVHFGDLQSIRSASRAELLAVDGIGPALADRLIEALEPGRE